MTTYIEDKVAEVPTLTLLGKRTKTVQKKIKSNLKTCDIVSNPFFIIILLFFNWRGLTLSVYVNTNMLERFI